VVVSTLVVPAPVFVSEVFVEHPGAATSTAAAISGVRIRSPRRDELREAMTQLRSLAGGGHLAVAATTGVTLPARASLCR
jgi:hypothetical protein